MAGVSLTICGLVVIPDKSYINFFTHGALGLLMAIYFSFLMYSSQFISYEDEDDHLNIRFGNGCCINWCMDVCCNCCSCMNGTIPYSTISKVDYIPSTSCIDGCGIRVNPSGDVVYSTSCCVPAVTVSTNDSCCCFTGKYVLQVEDEQQGQELILGINSRISPSGTTIV